MFGKNDWFDRIFTYKSLDAAKLQMFHTSRVTQMFDKWPIADKSTDYPRFVSTNLLRLAAIYVNPRQHPNLHFMSFGLILPWKGCIPTPFKIPFNTSFESDSWNNKTCLMSKLRSLLCIHRKTRLIKKN